MGLEFYLVTYDGHRGFGDAHRDGRFLLAAVL